MHSASRGFSLIELVIVVVILGIIGAIAIPRMSRGAEGAAEASLVSDLANLRRAIEMYQAEHDGSYPSGTDIAAQLTQYSSAAGATSATRDATHIYGPYLREIPALKVGSKRGLNAIGTASGETVAWLYDATTGAIRADLPAEETDAAGKPFRDY